VDEPGDVFPYGRYECDTALEYRSVIAFGTIQVVSDREEKARFCSELMRKYGDATWARPREFYPRLDEITVYSIAIERMTGKETALPVTSRRWPQLDQTKSPNAIPPEPR